MKKNSHEHHVVKFSPIGQAASKSRENLNNQIKKLPALSVSDWQKIQSWNKTEKTFSTGTIHGLFEEQVQKTPLNKAVIYQDEYLTYQELNNRANQLALDLIESGVGLETPVVIYLPSGLNTIIAILAVLKAGGIYIPVDVNYPKERVRFLIQDSHARIAITDTQKASYFSGYVSQLSLFNIDEKVWNSTKIDNLNLAVSPSNAMYVIYTSGSTGTPKGVLVEHYSAVNMAFSCIDTLQVTSESRILQIASLGFDVFVAEWCMSLLSGAALYLINKSFFSPDAIIDALKNYQISTIILSSSILSVLPSADIPSLKVIACGGEPCNASTIDFWAKDRLFLNIFGITEASVCSTAKIFKSGISNTRLIGKPLANVQIYILSQDQSVLPIGVPGEMWIGGAGIAREYYNNSRMTQDKFVSMSLSDDNPNIIYRLYRTGDFARWLPSGELEFIGREDDQIKIRGVRIESGEIECTLEKYPGIIKAIVLAKLSEGIRQLYGYIFSKNQEIDLLDVKNFLSVNLPSYMIPSKFVLVKEIPLTPNGKIDKERLLNIREDKKASIMPLESSGVEKTIINIAQSILKTENICVSVNFFDLGFDSFSLVQLYSELNKMIDTKINMADLFTYTTIKDLANYIAYIKRKKIADSEVADT